MPEDQNDVRAKLLQVLLSKVEDDTYPSVTMLDMIEELLTPDDVPGYVDLLLSRVSDDQFPSIPMLARVKALS